MKAKVKILYIILIFILLNLFLVTNSFAVDVENVSASYKNGQVTVSGKANCSKVAITILDENGTVKGLTNANVTNNTYSKTVNTGELIEGNKYTVQVSNLFGGDGYATTSFTVAKPEVVVSKISLSDSSKTMKNGESFTLTATISPSNATNKNITWKSSNNNVATVSNGRVVAKSAGKATITVTSTSGNHTASCVVEVIEEAKQDNSNSSSSSDSSSNNNSNSSSSSSNSNNNNSSSNVNKQNTSVSNANQNDEDNREEEQKENNIIQNEIVNELSNDVQLNEIIENNEIENSINEITQATSADVVQDSENNNLWWIAIVIVIILLIIIIFIFTYLRRNRGRH